MPPTQGLDPVISHVITYGIICAHSVRNDCSVKKWKSPVQGSASYIFVEFVPLVLHNSYRAFAILLLVCFDLIWEGEKIGASTTEYSHKMYTLEG